MAVSSWTMPVLVWPAFQADPHRPAATARRLVWISLAIALPTGPSMALLFRSMSSSASTSLPTAHNGHRPEYLTVAFATRSTVREHASSDGT